MKVVALGLALLLMVACSRPATPESGAAASDPAAEVVYVDVRTQAEYDAGHVADAILIPHDQMAARWQELSAHKDKTLVVYCRSGRRSGLALEVLKEKGFANVRNGGGFDSLAARGVPTEK